MAKKSMILKQQAPAKYSTRQYNRCKSWRIRARSPASAKLPGKNLPSGFVRSACCIEKYSGADRTSPANKFLPRAG